MTIDEFPRLRRLPASGYFVVYATLMLIVAALLVARSLTAADAAKSPPVPPPASQYAPAADLLAQVAYYIKRGDEVLASKEDFDDAAKSRLKKDANTLAVLGLALALHDDDNRLKLHAGDFIKAAQTLANAEEYDAAVAAFGEVKKKAAAGSVGPSENNPTQWEKVGSLGLLMKQVPAINAALKRGVSSPARLEKAKGEAAGQSAALAAIAQASMSDTHEVKNADDLGKWYQYCAEMRDAAGQVNAAVRAGDHAKTTAAMSRLAASCDTCHKVFRKGH